MLRPATCLIHFLFIIVCLFNVGSLYVVSVLTFSASASCSNVHDHWQPSIPVSRRSGLASGVASRAGCSFVGIVLLSFLVGGLLGIGLGLGCGRLLQLEDFRATDDASKRQTSLRNGHLKGKETSCGEDRKRVLCAAIHLWSRKLGADSLLSQSLGNH